MSTGYDCSSNVILQITNPPGLLVLNMLHHLLSTAVGVACSWRIRHQLDTFMRLFFMCGRGGVQPLFYRNRVTKAIPYDAHETFFTFSFFCREEYFLATNLGCPYDIYTFYFDYLYVTSLMTLSRNKFFLVTYSDR